MLLHSLELRLEESEIAANVDAFWQWFALLDKRQQLVVEDEAAVEHLSQLFAQLCSQPIDQDSLRFYLDDTHECVIKDKHSFGKHGDLMCLLRQEEAILERSAFLQHLL